MPTGGGGGSTGSPSSDTGAESSTGDDGLKRDVEPPEPEGGCEGFQGGLEFSYLWAANSAEGTVSKIDTETLEEIGRYAAHPDGPRSPSRTSVGLSGDVAVANRSVGITKIYARQSDCVESNGVPGIQTSSGPDDVLPWGEEECVAWFADTGGSYQRPVAWAPGTFNEETCEYENAKVWTTSTREFFGDVTAHRIDGETGAIDVSVHMPDEVFANFFGPYGGAVDPEQNFWFHDRDAQQYHLVRVDAEFLQPTLYEIPMEDAFEPYGIAIDDEGRIWLAGTWYGIGRFDPITETWDFNTEHRGFGIMPDGQGKLWVALFDGEDTPGVYSLDQDTMQVVDWITTPEVAKGISIDFNGYVWLVGGANAMRIDPASQQIETYAGLNGAYTYSDMTGFGLANVTPEG